MLNTYFTSIDPISKKRLESKVEEDIIQSALLEEFIKEKTIEREIHYFITKKGEKYRDE